LNHTALIDDPMTVLAVCASICAVVFWSARQRWGERVYRVVPSVVLIYFVPALLAAAGVLPPSSPVYDWMRDYLLPFSLFLLMATTDVSAILRIGPKALAMMMVGTLGVVLGGPLAFLLFESWLPVDSWKALAALSGSWIGGGGNFAAIKEAVGASDELIGPIIVVDTGVGYTWTGILLFLAGYQARFDRWNRADSALIRDLDRRMRHFQQTLARPITLFDASATLALGFVGAVAASQAASRLYAVTDPWIEASLPSAAAVFSEFTWMVLLISTVGIGLSLTPVRSLERGGASKLGYAALYLFLTSLGAKASLAGLLAAPVLLLVGAVWILVHIGLLFAGARLLRAPLFLVAVGSQANIGGAVTAPIVAAAYYEGLAPVGVLMGVLGYLLGTYAGLLCAYLLSLAA
jgi:uncharacterized membrane protein